jgi:hypothetical protein
MSGRHLPPDHSRGDETTLGGYMAVHARPAAFEGADGMSYSVDIVTDRTGDIARPYATYLLFLRWRRVGASGVEGHVESDYVAYGATEQAARAEVERLSLHEVKRILDELLRRRGALPNERRWWDAMRDGG